MKFKQNFPYIALAVLSLILLIVIAVITYLRTDFPFITLSHKLILVLQETVFTGGLILISVWIGVGVNVMLTRIADTAIRRRITIGITLGSFFLCILLPALGLVISSKPSSPQAIWQSLPNPPETPKAIAGAGYKTVFIETEDGNYFSCNTEAMDSCWQAAAKPETLVPQGMELVDADVADLPKVEGTGSVVCLFGMAYYLGSSRYEDYFVVLDDGTVWYLSHPVNSGMYATGLLAIVLIPMIVGTSLILFGIGLASLLRWAVPRT